VATLRPFRALTPRPADAARIAAVPYDVVTTEEARALAAGNPLSFLRVSRAEIDLPPGTDPYAPEVYDVAARNFAELKRSAFVVDDAPNLYLYRLRAGDHQQTGLAGCFSLDDYDRDVIRKHERTRRDKEDDRTRHMLKVGAQTGPVFLVYRASREIDRVVDTATAGKPLVEFEAADGVRHTLWRVDAGARDALIDAMARVASLYIADGHHRAASAARARAELNGKVGPGSATEADHTTFLAVAFPADQARILAYNRTVKTLGDLSPSAFLREAGVRFEIVPGRPLPSRHGEIAMYLAGGWHWLRPRRRASDPLGSLDVSVLQDELLAPLLGIQDVRTDPRIEFVPGVRGTAALEQSVDAGRAAAAFSLLPLGLEELMAVSDSGAIMPPKSTWFEPKLRDGLLIHAL
jgi:uncharacterized protein (DUF1015 family)